MTKGAVTVYDGHDTFHIFHSCDGMPKRIIASIAAAQEFAWPLPRFEGGDFAAAYIRATKHPGGGTVYLTTQASNHGDLSYRYQVCYDKKTRGLRVKVYEVACSWDDKEEWWEKRLFDGPLDEALKAFPPD